MSKNSKHLILCGKKPICLLRLKYDEPPNQENFHITTVNKILNRAFPWLQKACTYVDAKQRRFVNVTAFPDGLLHGWKTEGIGE